MENILMFVYWKVVNITLPRTISVGNFLVSSQKIDTQNNNKVNNA